MAVPLDRTTSSAPLVRGVLRIALTGVLNRQLDATACLIEAREARIARDAAEDRLLGVALTVLRAANRALDNLLSARRDGR